MKCPQCGEVMIKGKKFQICEECGYKIALENNYSVFEQKLVDEYPIFIALPFKRMLDESHPVVKLKLFLDVFTNILKYISLILKTEYLLSDLNNKEINEIIIYRLNRPLISDWHKFISAILAFFKTNHHHFFMKEISDFYDSVELNMKESEKFRIEKGYYDEEGVFVETSGKLGLIQAVISYRNSYAHGFNPPEEEAEKDFIKYKDVLIRILEKLDFTINYPILKLKKSQIYKIMGINAQFYDNIQDPSIFLKSSLIMLRNDMKTLELMPFIITPDGFLSDEESSGFESLIYDQNTGKGCYTSVKTATTKR